jgi:hypothetical protein
MKNETGVRRGRKNTKQSIRKQRSKEEPGEKMKEKWKEKKRVDGWIPHRIGLWNE